MRNSGKVVDYKQILLNRIVAGISKVQQSSFSVSVGFERFYHSYGQRFNFLFANLLTQLHEAA